MLAYAGLDNKYTINTLKKQLKELEIEALCSFTNIQLIPLLKLANTKNYGAIKRMVRSLSKNSTADDMAALLEDIEIELKDEDKFIKKKEDLK
jgi:hypothetical protein